MTDHIIRFDTLHMNHLKTHLLISESERDFMTDEKKARLAVRLYEIVTAAKEANRKNGTETDIFYNTDSGCLCTAAPSPQFCIHLYHLTADSPDVISIMALILDELELEGV